MHPFYHSLSSVKKWGGKVEDYQPLHDWMDQSKAHFCEFRHRVALHHSLGIYLLEQRFGVVIVNSDGRPVPVRQIGEQHVIEDMGFVPTLAQWCKELSGAAWMQTAGLSKQLMPELTKGIVLPEAPA